MFDFIDSGSTLRFVCSRYGKRPSSYDHKKHWYYNALSSVLSLKYTNHMLKINPVVESWRDISKSSWLFSSTFCDRAHNTHSLWATDQSLRRAVVDGTEQRSECGSCTLNYHGSCGAGFHVHNNRCLLKSFSNLFFQNKLSWNSWRFRLKFLSPSFEVAKRVESWFALEDQDPRR